MKLKSINLWSIGMIGLSLFLGITGRLDWWVIAFVWLMEIEINLKFKR